MFYCAIMCLNSERKKQFADVIYLISVEFQLRLLTAGSFLAIKRLLIDWLKCMKRAILAIL